MNYQYIEQLIERYFNCQTTLQEEQILRSFFAQEDVPGHLMPYAELFQYEIEAKADGLGAEFDKRMLALIQAADAPVATPASGEGSGRVVPLRPLRGRLAPFFRAAAVVAMVLTVGQAADRALSDSAAEGEASGVAIDPYIRQADISSAIRVKDMSQAEARPHADSLLVQPRDEKLQ